MQWWIDDAGSKSSNYFKYDYRIKSSEFFFGLKGLRVSSETFLLEPFLLDGTEAAENLTELKIVV